VSLYGVIKSHSYGLVTGYVIPIKENNEINEILPIHYSLVPKLYNTSDHPTIIYEDNAACISKMQTCYIKSNITKHISPK
jgi:hypothetical protein